VLFVACELAAIPDIGVNFSGAANGGCLADAPLQQIPKSCIKSRTVLQQLTTRKKTVPDGRLELEITSPLRTGG
jgi:hypothetical protein